MGSILWPVVGIGLASFMFLIPLHFLATESDEATRKGSAVVLAILFGAVLVGVLMN